MPAALGRRRLRKLPQGWNFSPLDLPSLRAWYRADGVLWTDSARTTRVGADGDAVGAWDDGSPLANHAVQATGANRPTYKAVGGPNGYPYLQARGTHWVEKSSPSAYAGGTTMFMVARQGASAPSNDWVLCLHDGGQYSFISGFAAGMIEYYGSVPRLNVGTIDGNWAIYEYYDNTTAATPGLKNGYVGGSGSTAGSAANRMNRLVVFNDDTHAFGADIDAAEFIVYQDGKGPADRMAVRQYLGRKYNIGVLA